MKKQRSIPLWPIRGLWLLFCLVARLICLGQQHPLSFGEKDTNSVRCGQKEVNEFMLTTRPALRARNALLENGWRRFIQTRMGNSSLTTPNRTPVKKNGGIISSVPLATVITLPVVVHIIHNNGPENISNAQVLNAIQHLNEAFANSGYYDPSDGVNTNLQFCLAERDTANVATSGITRNVSGYAVMSGPTYYSDDQNVKNINRWNPQCYINIWIVASIPGSVAGYAYLPAAHGTDLDGIIVEAGYFGSSYTNDVVITHEMGHFLGLYHTFEGGCTNTDCSTDGDRICDTPPDQSTAYISCGSSMNSCSTDALSGFATDQPDLTQDYMDYGNLSCMKVFTQLQSDRMNYVVQNIRSSLLHCKSCLPPCPAPVTAAFSVPGAPLNAGTAYDFFNSSVNAASYEWRVNGVPVSAAADLSFTFSPPGNYIITLIARSSNILCDSAVKTVTVSVVCPVAASFTKTASTATAGSAIGFTNTSTGATGYQWLVNSVVQSTALNYSYTTTTAGMYVVQLKAANTTAGCTDVYSDTVYFTCPVVADFTPSSLTTLVNTAVNFSSTGTGASSYQWSVNGTLLGTGASFANTFTAVGSYSVQLVAGNGVCRSVKTGVVYVTDKCGNPVYYFRKDYDPSTVWIMNDQRVTADGGSVVAGRTIGSTLLRGGLTKLDAAGNVTWFKNYGNTSLAQFFKVRTTADGGYIAIGNITDFGNANGKLFIVKTAADGTLVWSRQLMLDAVTSGTNIVQSAEGDYYFTGTLAASGSGNGGLDAIAGKLSSTGALLWLRSFDSRGNETPGSLLTEVNSVTVCGNLTTPATGAGFLLQLAKTDGSILWSRSYSAGSENFTDVLATASGYVVDIIHGGGVTGATTDHVFMFTDGSGNILSANGVTPLSAGVSIGSTSLLVKPNGNLVTQSSCADGGTYSDFVLQEIDPVTGPVWTKTYNEPNIIIRGMARKPDNSFFMSGFHGNGTYRGYVMSVDSLGNGGTCPANPVDVPWRKIAYQSQSPDWTTKSLQAGFASGHTATDETVQVNSKCEYIACDSVADSCALCKTLRLAGPDTLCASHGAYSFSATRSPGCTSRVRWNATSPFVRVLVFTDSTISLEATASGSFLLTGMLITPCDTLRDTIIVHVYVQPNLVNLGPDIALCKQSAVHLNAGSGFSRYLWQDGSTDSTFTAYLPGIYFVEAIDHCNNIYRDTVQITQAPDIPFDLGPDTTICLHDSVPLHAPAGFSSYKWSPVNYAISDPYAQNPVVYPAVDSSYTCTAEKYPGCTVVDTIRIHVVEDKTARFIDSAALLCAGGELQLKPTGTWNNYLWSTGANTPTIIVAAAGKYWLQVKDSSRCAVRDSISVNVTNCYTGIHFPNAFTPNGDGNNDSFRAILDAKPKTYLLVVYNRWGEKIFETRDAAKGWNGSFKGVKQDSGGFAWYAVYRLEDKDREETQNGIVILLR